MTCFVFVFLGSMNTLLESLGFMRVILTQKLVPNNSNEMRCLVEAFQNSYNESEKILIYEAKLRQEQTAPGFFTTQYTHIIISTPSYTFVTK